MDWKDADEIIGDQKGDDYILDLKAHEGLYKNTPLSELIASATPEALAASYHRFDGGAIAAQKEYFRWMKRANWSVFFTSVLGALAIALKLMATTQESLETILGGLGIACSIGAAAAAAFGAVSFYFLRQGELLEEWMKKRALAESHRIGYFESILSQAVAKGGDAAILALEYFRRYQFDVQQNYFYKRAEDHRKSAKTTVLIGAIGAGLATLFGAGNALSANGSAIAGALAVAGAALGALAVGREQMTQDRRNAERYDRTYAALVEFTKKLQEVRVAVTNGHPNAAFEFAASVNEHVSNEHRQWLEETEATQVALARIDAALQKATKPNDSHQA